MFDVQAAHLTAVPAADAAALRSIAAYYRRVTTDAFPMNRLIGVVMVVTVVGSIWRAVRERRWPSLLSALLAVGPIGLAAARVFPNAVQLGAATDVALQAPLARAILHDHVACFAAIAIFTALEVARSAPRRR